MPNVLDYQPNKRRQKRWPFYILALLFLVVQLPWAISFILLLDPAGQPKRPLHDLFLYALWFLPAIFAVVFGALGVWIEGCRGSKIRCLLSLCFLIAGIFVIVKSLKEWYYLDIICRSLPWDNL